MSGDAVKKAAFGSFAAVSSLLLVLASLEIVLRARAPSRDRLEDGRELILKASSAPYLQYELTPNASGYAWDTDVAINSAGFRDREYPVAKGRQYRIASVGDSTTFGNGLPVDSVYPKQLESLLASEKRGFEVLNFGVGGYDVLNYLGVVELRAAYRPDLVVIGFCVNDIGIASPNRAYLERIRNRGWLSRLQLVRFIQGRLSSRQILNWQDEQNQDDEYAALHRGSVAPITPDSPLLSGMAAIRDILPQKTDRDEASLLRWYTSEAHLGVLVYAFSQIRELAAARHFRVVVVPIPYLSPSTSDTWEIVYEMIMDEAKAFGFDTVAVSREFKDAGFNGLMNDRTHPNRKGHAIIARKLAAHVLRITSD